MPFKYSRCNIDGLVIIESKRFIDERGFFLESYKESDFSQEGITDSFSQDNHSFSSKGVLRGLHYQTEPKAQSKLVRVITGSVWDVAVDLRKDSPTYLEWFGIELNAENNLMFYIPEGFAHGFLTLSDNTNFLYKCSSEYSPKNEGGIIWNDKKLNIKWPIDGLKISLSDKDLKLPNIEELI